MSNKPVKQEDLFLTLWRLLGFGDIRKKTPKRMWLCARISPVRYALQTW